MSADIAALRAGIITLEGALAHEADGDALAHAAYAHDAFLPAMLTVRAAVDALESKVADDLWPLPTYQEMLFIL